MKSSYTVGEFTGLLRAAIPGSHFFEKVGDGGKAIWVFGENVWTLAYTSTAGSIRAVVIADERGSVEVSLYREAVVSLPAVLKAVGAV